MEGTARVQLRRPWLPASFYFMCLVKYSPHKGALIHHSPSVPSVLFKVLLALSLFASVVLEVWLIYLLSYLSETGNMEDKIFSQTSELETACPSVHPYIEQQILSHSMYFCLSYLFFLN